MHAARLVLDGDHAVIAAVRERVYRPAEELVGHVHAQAAVLHHEPHIVALAVHKPYLGCWHRLALPLERLWNVFLVQHAHGGRAGDRVKRGRSSTKWRVQRRVCCGGDEG